jgi:hypothetical protein
MITLPSTLVTRSSPPGPTRPSPPNRRRGQRAGGAGLAMPTNAQDILGLRPDARRWTQGTMSIQTAPAEDALGGDQLGDPIAVDVVHDGRLSKLELVMLTSSAMPLSAPRPRTYMPVLVRISGGHRCRCRDRDGGDGLVTSRFACRAARAGGAGAAIRPWRKPVRFLVGHGDKADRRRWRPPAREDLRRDGKLSGTVA